MPYLAARDPLADAKEALSSWDKCMDKSWCKWPVIAVIIIGTIIALSTILCIVRCIFCGAKCAMCCCSCCSCCSSSDSGHKRMKSGENGPYPQGYNGPPIPPPAIDNYSMNQQYRAHDAPAFQPGAPPDVPQYARFSSPSKPVNEDALPAMPSYSDAKVSYVEEAVPEKRGDMEMHRLDHNGSTTGVAPYGDMRKSPLQRSQTQDSFGFPPSYQNPTADGSYGQNDGFVSAAPHRSPHPSPGPYGSQNSYDAQPTGYRGPSPLQNPTAAYGGYGSNQQYGQSQVGLRHSPAPPSPSNYGDDYGFTSPVATRGAPYGMIQHDNYAPILSSSPSPGYAPTGASRFEPPPPVPAYSGQQNYGHSAGARQGPYGGF
ncbi:hypothetical protein BU24DRAFT_145680 [Aaosphaeria arxii CBS 175.79]|uniref:Fibroin-3 related protein n=1 Tax=Aaosphaeria arxii CBS 175.79 TaxID=1450172 RepID=A0A6A5XW39_9PLEO|nr:uncharacterized protein BU24DRAFT_145680 [Aaosphaeria arxii CBS 175.79]KAF2017189.1 hypothetical protein BU24DRAFT_145680 [Aaosphaeria arxii CBS 175.79]